MTDVSKSALFSLLKQKRKKIMLKSMQNIILKTLMLLEQGSITIKLTTAFILSVITSPIVYALHRIKPYIIPDADFVVIITIAIIVDWITGMMKWWMRKQFDFRKMIIGLLEKVAISYFGMILFNGLGSISELQQHPDLRSYLVLVGKLAIFFYVAGSAFNNMFYITGVKFPPIGWMNRMKNFEETADVDAFTDKSKPKDEMPN